MGPAEEGMISNYWPRLAWLALASFFLLHLLFASAVALAAPVAVRFAARLQPGSGARLILALRLLPFAVSLAIVSAVCVPSYFYYEPEAAGEQIGPSCIAAALLTLLLLLNSVVTALRATAESFQHLRRWRREGCARPIAGCRALVIESNVPFLALAGIFRPTLIATRGLLSTLPPAGLDAAIRHEQAHQSSRDNLKRLVMHCAPGLFPFSSGFSALEQAWAKLAEHAADDRSILGKPERALHLADALVRVARGGYRHQPSALTTHLLPEGTDLRRRVQRLLGPEPPAAAVSFAHWPLSLAAGCLALAALQSPILRLAHELLECLVR